MKHNKPIDISSHVLCCCYCAVWTWILYLASFLLLKSISVFTKILPAFLSLWKLQSYNQIKPNKLRILPGPRCSCIAVYGCIVACTDLTLSVKITIISQRDMQAYILTSYYNVCFCHFTMYKFPKLKLNSLRIHLNPKQKNIQNIAYAHLPLNLCI